MPTRHLTTVSRPLASTSDAGALLARAADLDGVALLDGGDGVSILVAGGTPVVSWSGEPDAPDPLEVMAEHLSTWVCDPHPRWPFSGGLVGWFGYDVRTTLETLPDRHARVSALPGVHLLATRVAIAIDETAGEVELLVLEDPDDAAATDRAHEIATALAGRVLDPARDPGEVPGPPCRPDDVTRPDAGRHREAVRRARRHILDGDVYQVNLAQRWSVPRPRDLVGFYRRLRAENPAAFGGFATANGETLLSVSPERFLRCDGVQVETRPIKGTAPRSDDPARDAALAARLRESEKDRAELAMIVDVMRNDLSRVCVPGTVVVSRPLDVETHPTVHHLVATVRGTLAGGRDRADLLRATLPGGSITGAPRIRAMELIDVLEPSGRGPYCGAFGYLGYDGRMDTNILIRSGFTAGDTLHFFGGGGIVAGSDPDLEEMETRHKVAGILRALTGEVTRG
ncbi:MAG: aminodeoxychorismate synthase component I [Planctomycetes bacterium]|nr:aminodeoxychorismate synthase component I [Planctomycetota bacterium]